MPATRNGFPLPSGQDDVSARTSSPEATNRAVTVDGRLVGSIASRALALLLESVRVRPLFARTASDDVRSLKVLQRAGFEIIGTERGLRSPTVEIRRSRETILRLDEPAKAAPSDVSSGERQTY
jgi:hypothetical protein